MEKSVITNLSQVTEIIIRCGSPNALKLFVNRTSQTPPSAEKDAEGNTSSVVDEKLKKIEEMTGETSEELIEKLERETTAKLLSEEIRKMAIKEGLLKDKI